MMTCPGTAYCTTVAHAARSAAEVRSLVAVHGGRHADDDRVRGRGRGRVGGELQAAVGQRRGQPLLVRVGQVGLTGAMSRSRCSLTSMPMIRGLLPCSSTAVGSPTYPRPTMATEPVVQSAAAAVSKVTSLV